MADAERRMPFLDHLDELRSCLRNSAIAVLLTTAISWLFSQQLFLLLVRPFVAAWGEVQHKAGLGDPTMIFTSPVEGFMVYFKLAILAGIFVASPVIFHQIWRFVSPGLYAKERRWGLGFICASVILFLGGAAFAYGYVLPSGYKFFLSYAAKNAGTLRDGLAHSFNVHLSQPFAIQPMIAMDEYLGFTSTLLLVFGVVFELPLLLAILALLGVVSAGTLWRFNRYAIVLFAIAGAVLTPGDLVVGQLAMTGALTILYNLSILLALMVGRARKREESIAAASAS